MATKNTIQGTLNWVAAFILNRPTVGIAGNYQEPGLTTANMFMATVLAPPFAWQWNRNTITFPTVAGTTDYTVAISDFGWLEKAQIHNATLNPSDYELTIYPLLSSSGSQARPDKITVFSDDNAGNYVFRLMSVPDLVYTVTLTYQKAPIQATQLARRFPGLYHVHRRRICGHTVYTASGGFTGGATNGLAGQYLIFASATSSANNGFFYVTAS